MAVRVRYVRVGTSAAPASLRPHLTVAADAVLDLGHLRTGTAVRVGARGGPHGVDVGFRRGRTRVDELQERGGLRMQRHAGDLQTRLGPTLSQRISRGPRRPEPR